MLNYDVLIVGAGPAGASCAWRLKRAGLSVALVDKSRFPRDKVCAGWITPAVVDCLQLDLDDYRAGGRTLQPFTGFRVGLIDGADTVVPYGRTVSYGIRRCEFDDYLGQRSGVPCFQETAVRQLERTSDGWVVNGRFRAKVLVGAGGHFCPVARLLGARRSPAASVVAAQEVEFRVPGEQLEDLPTDPAVPEIFFCPDLQGYGWCVRKGDFLNVGLGRVRHERLSEHVERFCEFLRRGRGVPVELPRFHGHAYQLYERVVPKLVGDAVLLVGDAAGLAYPQSGEGIRPAVESGLLAAETILKADGRYGEEHLQPYAEAVVRRFGRPRAWAVSDWLPERLVQLAARWLLPSAWFARRVVLDHWFLHVDQGPLRLDDGA